MHFSELTILVIDDYAATRDMVRSILRSAGIGRVIQAENGSSGMERLEEEEIDVIICDWNMPGMSGLEFLREVKSQPSWQHIPFLMLTAEAYRENVVEALNAGVNDYVAKPFTPEVLLEKVEAISQATRLA